MGRATYLVDLKWRGAGGHGKNNVSEPEQTRRLIANEYPQGSNSRRGACALAAAADRRANYRAPAWREDVALPITYSLEKAGAASAAAGREGETMQIDLPDVVAAVRSAFERYEQALVSNNVAELDTLFHHDVRTIRYGIAENLYGHAEVAAFRARRLPQGLSRTRDKTVITTYGHDFAVASTLFYRDSTPGKVGRQMQTWVRLPQGWRIVAAHVSLIDDPAKC
jgi:hypothetical protein